MAADCEHDGVGLTSLNEGVLQQERIGVSAVVLAVDGSLVDRLRLTSQASFVGREGHSLEGNAVRGHVVAGWDSNNVTNNKFLSIKGHYLAVTSNSGGSDILLGLQFLELLLLDIVVGGVDGQNDSNGDENGYAFNPSLGDTFVDDTEDEGYGGGSDEDLEDEVFEVFDEQLPEGLNFAWQAFIVAKPKII